MSNLKFKINNKVLIIICLFFLAASFILPTKVNAQIPTGTPTSSGTKSAAGNPPSGWTGPTNLNEWVDQILNWIFGVAGAIFVIMIIVGGLQYLTSAGNEDAASNAKRLMMNAVIGIVIVVSAWAISDWILRGIGGTANFG